MPTAEVRVVGPFLGLNLMVEPRNRSKPPLPVLCFIFVQMSLCSKRLRPNIFTKKKRRLYSELSILKTEPCIKWPAVLRFLTGLSCSRGFERRCVFFRGEEAKRISRGGLSKQTIKKYHLRRRNGSMVAHPTVMLLSQVRIRLLPSTRPILQSLGVLPPGIAQYRGWPLRGGRGTRDTGT